MSIFFFFCLRNHVIVVKIGENQDFLHYIAVLSSEPVSKWILQYMADKKYFRPQIEKKKNFPTFKKLSSQTPSMILPTYFHFLKFSFFHFCDCLKILGTEIPVPQCRRPWIFLQIFFFEMARKKKKIGRLEKKKFFPKIFFV